MIIIMKKVMKLWFLSCMVVGVCAGCSRNTAENHTAAVSAEPETTVTSTSMVQNTEEQMADVTATPVTETQDTDSATAKKSKKNKYAHWEYDENTHCLTISGKKETHDDKYAKDGQGEFFFNNFENMTDIPRFFEYKNEVKEVVIKKGVTGVSAAAFAQCTNLEKVTISDSVKKIGDYAFYECESLKEIVIPDGVTSIGKKCFYGCKSLEKITFGKKVKKIREGTFAGCESLRQITVKKGNKNLITENGILYHNQKKILYFAFDNAKDVNIMEGTTKIADCAFFRNPNMQTVKIPSSVTEIAGGAFYACKNLQDVTFSKQSKCTIIKDFAWDWDVGSYACYYGAFENCEKLKELIFPDNLKYIGEHCFQNCSSLQKIYFGRNFKTVRRFYYEEELNQSRETEIFYFPFLESLSALKEIAVSKSNKYFCGIDGVMFDKEQEILYVYPRNKTETKYKVPKSVKSVGGSAFYKCKKLKSLVIDGEKTKMSSTALKGSKHITIYGRKNSKAQKFAEKKKMKFIAI